MAQIGHKEKIFYGWMVILACFGINAIVHGIRYSFGVFFKSLSSDFDLSRAATSGISAVYWVLCAIFALLGGWILDRFGPRKIVFLMGIITAISLIATSQANASWQLYLTYSLLLAGGTGAVYSVLMTTAQRWFQKKRGMAVGIVSSGVGVGTIVMAPLTAYLISVFDWRTTYLIIGVVLGVFFVVLSLPLKRDPGEMGLMPDGIKQVSPETAASAPVSGQVSYSLSEAMRTTNFWVIAVIWFLWSFSLLLVLTHLVPHLTDLGIPPTTAAVIGGLIGFVSMVGRLGIGWVSDRLGRKASIVITVVLQTGALFLLAFSHQLWMFYLFAVIYAVGYGGLDPATLAMVGDVFGTRHLGRIMGALLVFWPFGAGLGSVAGGIIFDATGSYFRAFLLIAILMLIACIGAGLIRKK